MDALSAVLLITNVALMCALIVAAPVALVAKALDVFMSEVF